MEKITVFIFCVILNTFTVYCGGDMECIGKICYSDSSYPHEEIQQYWHVNETSLTSAFGNPKQDSGSSITSTTSACKLCATVRSIKVQPISIIEEGNQRLYVMNTENYPRPQFEIHICKSRSECVIPGLPDDYITKCVQRNSQMTVLVYNARSKKFEGKSITFPSHCECLVSVYSS